MHASIVAAKAARESARVRAKGESGRDLGGDAIMNLNAIPVVGWIVTGLFAISTAIPFWFIWTRCGIGEIYFFFLPETYKSIPFWDSVGLFIIAWILKSLFPKLASIENKANVEK
jgi:hypothetical protein